MSITPIQGISLTVNPVEGVAPLTVQYSAPIRGGGESISDHGVMIEGVKHKRSGTYTFQNPGTYSMTAFAVGAQTGTRVEDSKTITVREGNGNGEARIFSNRNLVIAIGIIITLAYLISKVK